MVGAWGSKRHDGVETPYVLLGLLVLVRVVAAYTWRFNNDEPQHLHVIWGWANGLMQYRDVFDNHAPLFHLLLAPVYALLGERADILILMRLAMLPLFFLSLWAIYLIGSRLYSKQVGCWAAVFAGLFPRFFLCSLELRADDLWMVPWLFALALLVRRPLRKQDMLLAGVLLGTAFGVSLKTTLLFCALAVAAVLVWVWKGERWLEYGERAVWLVAGMSLVPTALIAWFACKGDLGPMYEDIVRHNMVPGLEPGMHRFVLAMLALLAVAGTYWLCRTSMDAPILRRRLLIFWTYCAAMAGLYGFWPLITYQDFLPLIPLIAVFATALLLELGERLARSDVRSNFLPVLLSIVLFSILIGKEQPWHPMTTHENRLLAEVMQLTRPGDTIMDVKGETVFRQRPFFYALEGVTRRRIRQGLLNDDIEEAVVRNGTTVAALDSPAFPRHARDFLNQNFVRIGELRVAGQRLSAQRGELNDDILFNIRIPSRYMLVADQGTVVCRLDGSPYVGPRWLEAGRHVLHLSRPPGGALAVIWAPAVERGFSPFTS